MIAGLNEWVFNGDTIRQVLHVLMCDGVKIGYGQKPGQTIIFEKITAMQKKSTKFLIRNIPICPVLPR